MTGVAAEHGSGATVQRAGAWVDAGRPTEALADLAAVEREQGESIQAQRVRALALLALDRPEAALQAARRAVTLGESDSVSLRVLSTAALRCGEQVIAADAARRAVRADPGSWLAHVAVADALWRDPVRRVEALRASMEAVRLAPTEPAAHRKHGDVLMAAGRQREAQAAYRRGLQLAPQDPNALHNLAVSRLRRGHEGESAVAFAGLLANDPTTPMARRNFMVSVVNPLARVRFALGAGAVMAGFEYLVALDGPADGSARWFTSFPPAIMLVLAAFIVLRFVSEARPRFRSVVATARGAVHGWSAVAVTLGISVAVSVVGVFLEPRSALVAQGLVVIGVVVASVRIRRIVRAYPRTGVQDRDPDEEDAGDTDGDDDDW